MHNIKLLNYTELYPFAHNLLVMTSFKKGLLVTKNINHTIIKTQPLHLTIKALTQKHGDRN